MAQLFVVDVKNNHRWVSTIWTGFIRPTPGKFIGRPVSMRSAKKAIDRAQGAFPDSKFRIREVKEKNGRTKPVTCTA